MVLPVLGFSYLQPLPDYSQFATASVSGTRFVKRDAGTEAHAVELNGEFVGLKGSKARKQVTKSWDSYKSVRDQLVTDGHLVDSDSPEYFRFGENIPFQSSSAAATVVAAGNRNGRLTWKTEVGGETYAEWHDTKLAAVAGSTGED